MQRTGPVPVPIFIKDYVARHYSVDPSQTPENHAALWGIFLMLASILIIVSMLIMQAVMLSAPRPRPVPIPVHRRRRDVSEIHPVSD